MKPSEWCEENLTFPDGPMGGQRLSLFEFQKEPLDIITNPKIKKFVFNHQHNLSRRQ